MNKLGVFLSTCYVSVDGVGRERDGERPERDLVAVSL